MIHEANPPKINDRDIVVGGYEGGVIKFRQDKFGVESWSLPGRKTTQCMSVAIYAAEFIQSNQAQCDRGAKYRKIKS